MTRLRYETTRGIPTTGDTFAQLIEHIRLAQEAAAMLSHLRSEDRAVANGWLIISEQLKRMQYMVTLMATKRLQ